MSILHIPSLLRFISSTLSLSLLYISIFVLIYLLYGRTFIFGFYVFLLINVVRWCGCVRCVSETCVWCGSSYDSMFRLVCLGGGLLNRKSPPHFAICYIMQMHVKSNCWHARSKSECSKILDDGDKNSTSFRLACPYLISKLPWLFYYLYLPPTSCIV